MNKKRAFNLLKSMEFTRTGGSPEELRCANLLAEQVALAGGNAVIEEFDVNCQTITEEKLFADGVEIDAVGYGNSGSTPTDGLTAPFYYSLFNVDNAIDKINARGKIVLCNGYMGLKAYKALVDCGAVGFITYCGDVLDKPKESDLMLRELRQPLKDVKVLPGVNIRAIDAMKLVKQNPSQVTIKLQQDEGKCKSRNVVAEIKGEIEDEIIVFTAHYDSVHFSKGVYDNGAGSAILMELYRYFAQNLPRRTLRFIWCGSEERGLLGSRAYVQQHETELDKIIFVINVDVGAPVLGIERAVITADQSLTCAVDYMAKEVGFPLQVKTGIYSSDTIPFADKGIPGINFSRDGAKGCDHIHDRNDTMFYLSADALFSTGEFVEKFADRFVNSYAFPVPRSIPDNVRKDLDEYLGKSITAKTENK